MIPLLACSPPPSPAPADAGVFPYVYTPETDLEPYEQVRVETETWTPREDATETALYVQKALLHRPGAPVESVEHFVRMEVPPLGEGLRLSFAGDVMWIGGNWSEAMVPVAHLFDGDLRVANLETPTSPDHPTEQGALGLYAFNAPPEYLDGLPFDVLQLNNNHSLDAGDDGLAATVEEVLARGFVATGVDTHAIVDRVAFLSFTWGLNVPLDTTYELFVVPFGHLDSLDVSPVADAIAAAAADVNVVLVHWGFEYEYYADPHFLVLARAIVAAGADLIVGQGPHVVQPPEICHVDQGVEPGIGTCAIETGGEPRDAAVLYSLGNAATTMATLPCQVGIVATVSIGDAGVTGMGWEPIVSDDATVRETGEDEADEVARLTELIGGEWRR